MTQVSNKMPHWQPSDWKSHAAAALVVVVCVLVGWGTHALGLTDANVVMILLAGVALVAARLGRGPAIASAILSVLAFDFFFVKPVFSFNPGDAQYFITLVVMLGIGILISQLVARRDQSQLEVQHAQVQVQAEQVRSALLSAVSHDLRTPLATIAATASSLVESGTGASWPEKVELLQAVVDESNRLSRQVDNLLDMARLNSGAVTLNRDWHVLEELLGLALTRLRRELADRTVQVSIPEHLPLLLVAGDLIKQMFINLLENAVRYTQPGSRIEISVVPCGDCVEIRFADDGPGLPPGSEDKIFDAFFRGKTVVVDGQRGVGLGLAICRAIASAHGGEITAANRATGGAQFNIRLPCPPGEPIDILCASTAEAIP
jgi:two-component system sensor histidine kinase KdpD